MNCPTCHTPARHVAGQVHYCAACNRNLLDRGEPKVMQCGHCAAWVPIGKRPEYGLCINSRSRRDETSAGDTCAFWEPI